MQEYLYVWNDVETGSIVASGLSFSDLISSLDNVAGVILLRHHSEVATCDLNSSLMYVDGEKMESLLSEDIYSWGDFYWIDYSLGDLSSMNKSSISEIEYFSKNATPMNAAGISGLNNKYMAAAHDDGWFVRLYYSSWDAVVKLFASRSPELTNDQVESLRTGEGAFWIQNGSVVNEEKTFNVDAVINRNLRAADPISKS